MLKIEEWVLNATKLQFYKSFQVFSTHSFILFLYSTLLSEYNFAASAFAGDSGFGSDNNDWIDDSTVLIEYICDHWLVRISKQIFPSV